MTYEIEPSCNSKNKKTFTRKTRERSKYIYILYTKVHVGTHVPCTFKKHIFNKKEEVRSKK